MNLILLIGSNATGVHFIFRPISRFIGYTVHGDAVNLAARLEQLNKELGTWILVSKQTHDAVGDTYEFNPRGEYPIRGQAKPVFVYEVVAPRGLKA